MSDVSAAGSLLGLSENDVGEFYQVAKSSKLKHFLAHSFLKFLFGLLAVVVIALILSQLFNAPPNAGVVPMYAVPSVASIKGRTIPS
jgi:hypothetical protein